MPWLGSVRTGQAPGAQSSRGWEAQSPGSHGGRGVEHGAGVLQGHQKAGMSDPGPGLGLWATRGLL